MMRLIWLDSHSRGRQPLLKRTAVHNVRRWTNSIAASGRFTTTRANSNPLTQAGEPRHVSSCPSYCSAQGSEALPRTLHFSIPMRWCSLARFIWNVVRFGRTIAAGYTSGSRVKPGNANGTMGKLVQISL